MRKLLLKQSLRVFSNKRIWKMASRTPSTLWMNTQRQCSLVCGSPQIASLLSTLEGRFRIWLVARSWSWATLIKSTIFLVMTESRIDFTWLIRTWIFTLTDSFFLWWTSRFVCSINNSIVLRVYLDQFQSLTTASSQNSSKWTSRSNLLSRSHQIWTTNSSSLSLSTMLMSPSRSLRSKNQSKSGERLEILPLPEVSSLSLRNASKRAMISTPCCYSTRATVTRRVCKS